MDWTTLRDYVGAERGTFEQFDPIFLTAVALVRQYIGRADVPLEIEERAYLEVGSELYHRKNAPNGIAQFDTFGAAPIRVARDPMVAARALLDPFLPLGFA